MPTPPAASWDPFHALSPREVLVERPERERRIKRRANGVAWRKGSWWRRRESKQGTHSWVQHDLRLDAITPGRVEIHKSKKLDQGLARKSINNHMTVLRRALAVGVEWGLIASVPVIRWLDLPPAPNSAFSLPKKLAGSSTVRMPSGGA